MGRFLWEDDFVFPVLLGRFPILSKYQEIPILGAHVPQCYQNCPPCLTLGCKVESPLQVLCALVQPAIQIFPLMVSRVQGP